MTVRAFVLALFALPLAAAAQVGGAPTAPAPVDPAATPPPQAMTAPQEAIPPAPVAPAPMEAPPPPPVTPPPQAMAPPPPQAIAPPPPPAPAPAQAQAPPPAPAPAQAEPARPRRENPWRVSASVGAGSSYGNTYFLVGARLGRDLVAGLALELDAQYWAGQTPSLFKIAPGLTWYAPLRLYVGAYYARWFVGSGFADQNAVGARAGYTLISRGRTFAGVGVAYERALSCSSNCDSWWPEASVGVSF